MATEIKFRLTERDYADAAHSQYLHRLKSPRRWVIPLAILVPLFGLLAYSQSYDWVSFTYNLIPYVLILLIVAPVVAALTYFACGRQARRLFRQQSIQPDTTISWDDGGLMIRSSLGTLDAKWSHFYCWRRAGRTYLVHLNEALYYLIPGHALSDAQSADLESTLVRNGVPNR